MRKVQEKDKFYEVNANKEFIIKSQKGNVMIEKGDKIRLKQEKTLQGTFGFGGEANWVEPDSIASIDDKERIEFEKVFSKEFEKEFGEVPSSDLLDKAVLYYRRNDETHRDVNIDARDIVQEIKENLDKLIEDINEYVEKEEEYYTSIDYAEEISYIVEESDFSDGALPKNVLEKAREYGLTTEEEILRFLWNNDLIDVDVEFVTGYYNPYTPDNGYVLFQIFSMSETEIQFGGDIYDRIHNLTYEEYNYVRENVNVYMSDSSDKRDWDLAYISTEGFFVWYMLEETAIEILDDAFYKEK